MNKTDRSNVLQEKILLSGDTQTSLLGMCGLVGMPVTLIEAAITKEHKYLDHFANKENIGYYFGFVACSLLTYELIPQYVKFASATLLNLSNLSTPIYASILQHFFFRLPWVSFRPL